MPIFHDGKNPEGTYPPVDDTWWSPFIGKSLQEITAWIREIPKPPTTVNKAFSAVLQKELYDQKSQALMCKIIGDGEEVQTFPVEASAVGAFQFVFRREEWDEYYEDQELVYI